MELSCYISAMFVRIQRRFTTVSGFTLLELSIVVAIVALMIAAMLPLMTQEQERRRNKELNFRMDQIEAALQKFVEVNNRLPCPAPRGYATDNASYGLENTAAGTCTSPGGTYGPASNIIMGLVPTRTLGLPDDYGFDAWDRSFTYVVDPRATGTRALSVTYPLSDVVHGAASGTTLGSIIIKDSQWSTGTTSIRTSNGIAVIVSHGPNGHGAYPRASGTSTAVPRYNVGVTNLNELDNCKCTSATANSTGSVGAPFWAMVPAPKLGALLNSYDDRVRYYTRSSFTTNAERQLP